MQGAKQVLCFTFLPYCGLCYGTDTTFHRTYF